MLREPLLGGSLYQSLIKQEPGRYLGKEHPKLEPGRNKVPRGSLVVYFRERQQLQVRHPEVNQKVLVLSQTGSAHLQVPNNPCGNRTSG